MTYFANSDLMLIFLYLISPRCRPVPASFKGWRNLEKIPLAVKIFHLTPCFMQELYQRDVIGDIGLGSQEVCNWRH
jgi:hypothetical protein